jgi:hypothetical protein
MRDRSGEYKFKNNRSAMWWKLREALDPAFDPTLCLPPHDELTVDLVAPKYKLKDDVIHVELKDDIKARIGRSTDFGDAVGQSLLVDPMFDESYEMPVSKPVPYAENNPNDGSVVAYADTNFSDWISR